VTLIDGNDTLSGGGPRYATDKDYTGILNATGDAWSGFKLVTDWNGPGNGDAGSNALCTFSVSASSVSMTSPVSQTLTNGGRGVFQYGQLAPVNNVNVVATKVYRLLTTWSSNNAAGTSDPQVFVRLNGRTTVGMGEFMTVSGTASPTTSASTASAFLWPAAAGSATPQLGVIDGSATQGGTFTATNIIVDSFDPTKLIGKSDLKDVGNGASTGFTFGSAAGQFALAGPFSFVGMSNVSFTTTGTGSTALVLTGSGSASSTQGFAYYGAGSLFTTSASSKLVLVKVNISSSTTGTPAIRLRLGNAVDGSQPTFWLDRNTDAGPSATAKDYYVIFESTGSAIAYDFFVDALLDGRTALNGELKVNRITVSEYAKPN